MLNKYFDGVIQPSDCTEEIDGELKAYALDTVKKVDECFKTYRVADAIEAVLNLAKRSNKYIDETMPWALAKDEDKKARLGTVLYNLLESIRFISVLLSPFMPETSEKIFAQMNCDIKDYASLSEFGAIKEGTKVGTAVPLFQRIDTEKMLKEIAEKNEKAQAEEKAEEEKEEIAEISIDDFFKSDLRVAKILECEKIKKSNKLLKMQLDDGSGTPRQIVSGIAKWYAPEDLIGKKAIIVTNLKPVKLCGELSQGMLLSGEKDGEVAVTFVDLPVGAKIC